MPLNLEDIEALFARRGGEQYSGEPVTQLAHALQTAQRAERDGADDPLVTAALLRGIDDLHQFYALPFLHGVFGEQVLTPIKWHVDAKRYLCATRRSYWAGLSADSKRSLELQGGVFSADQAEHFIGQPHAAEAVRLRLWDDLAKEADCPTPPLAHFLARAQRCMLK